MIAVVNRLPVKDGGADRVVEMFAGSRGSVQGFPGFVSMEVLRSEDASEVMVMTRWQDKASFDAWVASEEFARAHRGSGTGELLAGHPKMTSYEVVVERKPA